MSVTNYQLLSSAPAGGTLKQLTYRADLLNGPTPWGGVTATVTGTNPFVVRIVPSQNTLTFPAVAANGQVTSTNTFAILTSANVLDTTKISWTFQTTAQGPVANAGPSQTVAVGTQVTLNGSASTNPSGVGTLTYKWVFSSRPAGTNARLTSTYGVMSGFTVDVPGNYTLTLTVSNGISSSSSNVTISTNNTPPVANAGSAQFVDIGTLVQLNGSGSTDVDGNPLTYLWSLTSVPSNSLAALSDPTAVKPTFTADLPGTYTAQLVVNDGKANSIPATVTITTNPPSVPTAFAGTNRTVAHNTTITLYGVGVDPQGHPLLYQWTLLSEPMDSTSQISNPNIPQPTLFVDRPGVYVAQLVVNNGTESSVPSTVTITTTNTPPVANAGPDQTVQLGRSALLDGSGSSDADNDPITYSWSLLHLPTGSAATLSTSTGVFPSFTPDVAGVYVVQLIVSDPYSSSNPSTVTITVPAPVTVTLTPSPLALGSAPGSLTATLSVAAGTNGIAVNLSSSSPTVAAVPASVTVLSGATTANVPVTPGTVGGTTTITASGPALVSGTATVNFTPVVITLTPSPLALGSALGSLTVTLSAPAGPGGVVVNLASSNTTAATVPATVTVLSGATTASVTVTPGNVAGTTTITASSPYMTSGTATVNFTPVVITLTPSPLAINLFPGTLTVTLSAPAGPTGVPVSLASSATTAATVPATVTVLSGATTASVTVTPGSASGSTTITASAQYMASGTATVNYTKPTIILSSSPINVAVGQQTTFPVNLNIPAPSPNGVAVTLSSSDSTKVKLASTTVTIPAGLTAPVKQPLINGVSLGSPTITASAPLFPMASQTVNTSETASFYPNKISLPFPSSVRYTWIILSGAAPTGGLTIKLSSDNPAVAKVPATITIPAGSTQVQLYPTGVSVGSATIHASLPPYIPDTTATVTIGQ